MPGIRPELIEKAAKELARKWCLREGHVWDSETWEFLPLDTILRFRADATDALLSIADDLRADAWDEALSSMCYSDGSPVEIIANRNPYRASADQ